MIEVLKQMVEALEFVNKSDDDGDFMNSECSARVEDAIETGLKAISELESQEPVAQPASEEDMKIYRAIADNYRKELTYPPQRTEQEPVAWCIWLCGGIVGFFDKQDEAIEEFKRRNQEYPDESRKLVPLYTHPPQRTWQGLTDEDIRPLCKEWWMVDTAKQWVAIIEAKLKERNS